MSSTHEDENAGAARPGPGPGTEALRVENISKRFGPVTALRDINLSVRTGEMLGLLGDNGAGKSTLIKIITGFHRPDTGRVLIGGQEVALRSVAHARSLGIETVYQDLALVDELPVYLNFFLNKELSLGPFLRRGEMKRRAAEALTEIGIDIPSVTAEVGPCPADNGRRSPSPAPSTPARGCCCSTNRSPPWAPARAARSCG